MASNSKQGTVQKSPWSAMGFRLPEHIPTMITREEVEYLYWLASDYWTGRHDLVEVGPWLGGSTYCLAAGMAANPRRSDTSALHVLDNFKWQEFMGARADLGLEPGGSFRNAFEANLSDHADLLRVHEARLPDEPILEIEFGTPLGEFDADLPLFDGSHLANEVEIVFIDGAKSWRALVHLLRELGPRFIPGTTVLVFQDYKVTGGYWVQICVARLLEASPPALELLHVLPFNSVAFRLTESFEPQLLADLPESIGQISGDEGVALLDRIRTVHASAGDEEAARLADLSAVVFLGSKDMWESAVARFRAAEARWPLRVPAGELDRVRNWMEDKANAPVRPSARSRTGSAYGHIRSKAAGLRRRLSRA